MKTVQKMRNQQILWTFKFKSFLKLSLTVNQILNSNFLEFLSKPATDSRREWTKDKTVFIALSDTTHITFQKNKSIKHFNFYNLRTSCHNQRRRIFDPALHLFMIPDVKPNITLNFFMILKTIFIRLQNGWTKIYLF